MIDNENAPSSDTLEADESTSAPETIETNDVSEFLTSQGEEPKGDVLEQKSEETVELSTNPPNSEGEKSEEAANETKPEAPKVNRRSERIQELNTRAQKAESKSKRFERELESLKLAQVPLPEDFSNDEEYEGARIEYQAKQTRRINTEMDMQESQAEQAETAEEQKAETQKEWLEKANSFAEKTPDYHVVVAASNVPMSSELLEAIQSSDDGPGIAYHLAKNPAKAFELSGMSPMKAAVEIGRIEAGLNRDLPRKISKAPAPQTKVEGKPVTGEVDFNALEGKNFEEAWYGGLPNNR